MYNAQGDCRPPEGYRPPDVDGTLLVALSGGPDSVCLLDLLVCGGYPLEIAHVNHHIRGDDADRDELFCRNLAAAYGLPIHVLSADVPALAAAAHRGLEETARNVRYDFFGETARTRGISAVATAHNADDNLETVIFNITRGAGARGGAGIPPVRREDGVTYVRPIIAVPKAAVLAYCKEKGLSFVTDVTNADVSLSRNRIRHLVAPELRVINPSAEAAFARFSEALREDCDCLDAMARDVIENAAKNATSLNADTVASLPAAVGRRVLLFAATDAGASPEARHADAMYAACLGATGSPRSLSIPGRIRFHIGRNGELRFSADTRAKRAKSDANDVPEYKIYPVEGENTLPCGAGRLNIRYCDKKSRQIYNLSTIAALNVDKIEGQFFVRSRVKGEVYPISIGNGNAAAGRDLRRFLSRQCPGLDPRRRALLPVICDDGGVLWVPGLPVCDRVRVHEDEDENENTDTSRQGGRIMLLEYTPAGNGADGDGDGGGTPDTAAGATHRIKSTEV